MYDTMSSNLLRLARRRWYVPAGTVIVGILIALGATSVDRRWTGDERVLFQPASSAAGLLGIQGVTNVDTRQVAILVIDAFEQTPLSDEVRISAIADTVGNLIHVAARGPNESRVSEALAFANETVHSAIVLPLLEQVDAAMATQKASIAEYEKRLEDLDSQLEVLEADATGRELVLVDRLNLSAQTTDAQQRLSTLDAYRSFVSDRLVTITDAEPQRSSASRSAVMVGVVGGAVTGFLILLTIVLTDRRVRRRIHLERAAPFCPVVGVLPATGAQPAELGTILTRTVSGIARVHGLRTLCVVGLGDPSSEQRIIELIKLDADDLQIIAGAGSYTSLSASQLADSLVILVARWGITREDDVASAATALADSGVSVATALVEVPRQDLSWANLTARDEQRPQFAGRGPDEV
jgi:hypothetical protein